MKSPMGMAFHSAVWVITALGCIHLGLMALDYNVLSMWNMMKWAQALGYIFGIAGVISLVTFITHSYHHMSGGSCTCC